MGAKISKEDNALFHLAMVSTTFLPIPPSAGLGESIHASVTTDAVDGVPVF